MNNETYITIHTDGSCIGNPGPGGYAAVLREYQNGKEIKRKVVKGHITEQATNNRMEMLAAIKALRIINMDKNRPITIYSDSSLLVRGMTEWIDGWIARGWKKSDKKPVENQDLWEELLLVSEDKNIEWQRVRGHAGDPFNEEVDRLALAEARKAAARMQV